MVDDDDIHDGIEWKRYEVLSTHTGEPDDVSLWCETATLWKAQAVFALLKTHRERLDIRHMALIDRDIGTAIRSTGTS